MAGLMKTALGSVPEEYSTQKKPGAEQDQAFTRTPPINETPPPPSLPPDAPGDHVPAPRPVQPSPTPGQPPKTGLGPNPVYPGRPEPIGIEPVPVPPGPQPGGQPDGTRGYTTTPWTPTTRNVQTNETVAGQLDAILAADSPVLQRARMRAAQGMNERGLMNSSMALQAGEAAAIDAAVPIAGADAATYGRAASENLAIQNQAGQFNAAQGTDAARFMAAGDLQMQTQRLASQLDTGSRERLMAIEQNYRHLTNNSAAANQLVQSMNGQIGAILADPNIAAENKQGLIQKLIDNSKFSLQMLGAINGIDFGNLLNFAPQGSTAPVPSAPNPTPAPSPGTTQPGRGGLNSFTPTSPPPGPGYRWIPGQGWVYSAYQP